MNPKVSVIIPVYKVQDYLEDCLESVRNQEYENIEIILVDDGSPDKCPEMCDVYAAKDTRIKVVHKQNEGLGLTRNAGVDVCTGEYITFVDSDDRLDGNKAVSRLINMAVEKKADVVVGSFRRFSAKEDLGINVIHLKNDEDVMNPDFRFRGFYKYNHLAYAWGKLYRKSFLLDNGLKHGAYTYAEDKAFNIKVYACRPKYAFVYESVYCYRVNEDSLTFKYKKDLTEVWVAVASDFSKFLKEKKIKLRIGDLPAFHIWLGAFYIVQQEIRAGNGILKAYKKLKEYARIPYVKSKMRSIITKNYTKGIKSKSWRWLIKWTSRIFDLNFYLVFTIGIVVFVKLKGAERVTKRRYKTF